MSSNPYTMLITSVASQSKAVPNLNEGPNTVLVGRGASPTIWPVDISELLAVSYDQVATGTRPSYRWPTRREAAFTLQAIEGSADVDKLRKVASSAANDSSIMVQITVYHGTDPFTSYGYITAIAPRAFEWKDGNVLLEVHAVLISPWVKFVEKLTAGGTFELHGDMPGDVYYKIGRGGGSFTIECPGYTTGTYAFKNTYGAGDIMEADTTRRLYSDGVTNYQYHTGGTQGSGTYFLEKIGLKSYSGSDNQYTLSIDGAFQYANILDNYSQPVWSV